MQTTTSNARTRASSVPSARQMLNKVPEITFYFWVIKVLCTTVGETASDYLSDNVGLGRPASRFEQVAKVAEHRSHRAVG